MDKQEQANLVKEYWKALYAAHEVDEERVEENGEDKDEEEGGGLGEAIEKEEVRVALKEMKKGKAVGVDDIPSEFLTEMAITKAKKLKGVIKNVTADTYKRAGVATKLWETLAIPSILYGAEVFDMADSDKHRLEIIERQVGRWAVGGNKGT